MTSVPRIIVFDVNETLLDVGALAPEFQRVFGNAGSPMKAMFQCGDDHVTVTSEKPLAPASKRPLGG